MKNFFLFISLFTLLITVWSMDTTHRSSSHGNPSRDQSPDRIRGLGFTGKAVEKHLQRQKVPKEERANVRWEKLQQFTGNHAKALERHEIARDKLLSKLTDPTYMDTHRNQNTPHHQKTKMHHDYQSGMVRGHRDLLHGAEGDLKIYQHHNGISEHASIPELRKVIRGNNPSYVSPPPSPVRIPSHYDSDASSATSSPSSTPPGSPTRPSSP